MIHDKRFEAIAEEFMKLHERHTSAFYIQKPGEILYSPHPLVEKYWQQFRICRSLYMHHDLGHISMNALEQAWENVQSMVQSKIK